MTEVYLPISPQIDQGFIVVKIQTITQINRKDFEIELEILVFYPIYLLEIDFNLIEFNFEA